MTRHFLIDTDTGSDDAVALVMGMQHPGVQVEAITVVAGNVPVDQGVQNALYTVEAWQLFLDDRVGSLEVGKLADLVVLSNNPRKTDPAHLDEVRVLETYREGRRFSWAEGG